MSETSMRSSIGGARSQSADRSAESPSVGACALHLGRRRSMTAASGTRQISAGHSARWPCDRWIAYPGCMDETVICKREDLYDQVWAEPMRTVAKRYGVSDVALAKICRK